MQDILTIIQTVGFPIAVAIAMFVMLQNEQKAHREESEKLTGTITELKITFNTANNKSFAAGNSDVMAQADAIGKKF